MESRSDESVMKNRCANYAVCNKDGNLFCKKCCLVGYCSRDCQAEHWPTHKKVCKSPLVMPGWQPAWFRQHRRPGFSYPRLSTNDRFLVGNLPAVDILNIKDNEGVMYQKDLDLCFAASGDPRNIIKTVLGIPPQYGGQCRIVINDRDSLVVVRNIIILIIATQFPREVAVDTILHLWYSAAVTPQNLVVITAVGMIIRNMCNKIVGRDPDSLASAKFGTVSVHLTVAQWMWTLQIFKSRFTHSIEIAQATRLRAQNTVRSKDLREQYYMRLPIYHRVAYEHFHTTGVFLPFSASTMAHTVPNPTFFTSAPCHEWLCVEGNSALQGWARAEVLKTGLRHGVPPNDIFGATYFHVRDVLDQFCRFLPVLKPTFILYHSDVVKLNDLIPMDTSQECILFDRIDISNISDRQHVGHRAILKTFLGAHLKPPHINPCATLLQGFMTFLAEIMLHVDKEKAMGRCIEALKTMRSRDAFYKDFLKYPDPKSVEYHWFSTAYDLYTDSETIFARVKDALCDIGESAGVKLKTEQTIVERWPFKLKSSCTDLEQMRSDFDTAHAVGLWGFEMYLEWMPNGAAWVANYHAELEKTRIMKNEVEVLHH